MKSTRSKESLKTTTLPPSSVKPKFKSLKSKRFILVIENTSKDTKKLPSKLSQMSGELNSFKFNFSFFLFFSLFFLPHAELYLDRFDHDAFVAFQRDLGINSQHSSFTRNPCSSPAVSCEQRVVNHISVLRITRAAYDSKELRGFISPVIGQLTELRELTLSNNQLVNQVPQEIVHCTKLEILNLKNNHFSGHLPYEFSKLECLREVDLSSNQFCGNLSFLRHLPNLEKLSLADNRFTGKIPPSLRWFQKLRFFDISGNDKVEHIYSEVSRKSLVPKRYSLVENSTRSSRCNSSEAAKAGRNHSCDIPAQIPSSVVHKHHDKGNKKLAIWLLGFIVGGVFGGVFGMLFLALVKMVLFPAHDGEESLALATLFDLHQIKAKDIAFLKKESSLASLQLIGKGGCGQVYKAELRNGKLIAIKKILECPKEDTELAEEEEAKVIDMRMRQIQSEIQTVGEIRHRNLLPLLAHVPRPNNCHYLVYEYMQNGSLQDLMQAMAEGSRELDWWCRYKILLGVADGLEYLHMNNTQRIIHRDLKPANILLDVNMEPRIADFGLAMIMPDDYTHMTTLNIVGTVGYIAPEYPQTGRFTDKCEIYSFGVIIGGLMMGKLPGDVFFQHTDEQSLVKWMRNAMDSQEPEKAIDSKLRGNGYEEQMLQILKIACSCTSENPKERPNIGDVRTEFSRIKSFLYIAEYWL